MGTYLLELVVLLLLRVTFEDNDEATTGVYLRESNN